MLCAASVATPFLRLNLRSPVLYHSPKKGSQVFLGLRQIQNIAHLLARLLQFRFDRPGDPAITELEGISGPGDSGGAAFQEIDGKLYVVGVSSWQDTRPTGRKQGLYGVIEHYVRVSSHYDWIMRTLREAN